MRVPRGSSALPALFLYVFALMLIAHAASAIAATYKVGIGDDCAQWPPPKGGCFEPQLLTIQVGDSVSFYGYADNGYTGAHNVVADDGSFRCAIGCEDAGGSATPVMSGDATRKFTVPGIVVYHDEVGGATGAIIVKDMRPGVIGPGFTGLWYDPAQSGHGIFIQVLPNNRFFAAWLSFNAAGTEQVWFEGVGTYSDNNAVINAVMQPTGGRWIPNFDPRKIVLNPWGTLTFTFLDCNHGVVNFSSGAAYGSGSMNLVRVTMGAGLSCP